MILCFKYKKKKKKRVMPIISSNYSLCHSLNSHLTRSRNESYFPHCVKLKTENSTTSHSSFESFFKLGVYMSFYEDLKWDYVWGYMYLRFILEFNRSRLSYIVCLYFRFHFTYRLPLTLTPMSYHWIRGLYEFLRGFKMGFSTIVL
jgi:hypothetical protein